MKIVFLDDDPVIRVLRLVLLGNERHPSIRDFFKPEVVDLSGLSSSARGLRARDGSEVALMGPEQPIRGANVIIFRRATVARDLLEANPDLRLIQRLGERPDGIDVGAAHARRVWVSCLPRKTLAYTAEHVLMLMLALAKRLLACDRAVRAGTYDPRQVPAVDEVAYNWPGMTNIDGIHGKTVGLIGLGEVGSLVARLAQAFGARVLYHKRHRASAEEEGALKCAYAPLGDLLACADFVSLHASNVPENENLIDTAVLGAMRPSAFFINTSRGRLVDEDALYSALVTGVIAGAALDVHRPEPRAGGDRFSRLPNVVLTPHVAGGARSGLLKEFQMILENCQAAMRGEAPVHGVIYPTAPLRD